MLVALVLTAVAFVLSKPDLSGPARRTARQPAIGAGCSPAFDVFVCYLFSSGTC